MSDISRTRATPTTTSARGPRASATATAAESPAALDTLLPALETWLPRQRWFAGKGVPMTALTPLTCTTLSPRPEPLLHCLVQVEQPNRPADTYQLLLGARTELPPALAPATIGRFPDGPYRDLLAYDALHDPAHNRQLLTLLADERNAPPGLAVGRLPDTAVPTGLTPRLGTAEQSNSSVVYGDTLILKLFRRVSPGTNPDLELTRALARAGSTRVPAPVAWLETETAPGGEAPTTLALLQRFLKGGQDGWELALSRARELLGTASAENDEGSPTGNFAAESFLLGRATAEVHLTLARSLPATAVGAAEITELTAAMTERLDAASAAVPALAEYRSALRSIYRDLAEDARAGRTLRLQRIHGDLHLGQAMRTPRGWVLLDFEGEPAAPLAERRLPQPATRDVAAMLRSFDYAAAHLLSEEHPELPGGPTRGLERRAARWAARNREAFCAGYAAAGGQDPRTDPVLLRAMETDKAVYEVVYEARHRPTWLPIPLAAIRRLTATRGPRPD